MRSKKVTLLGLLAAAAMILTLTGCGDVNLKSTMTIYGKVIDAETKMGLGGGKVHLKVNGKWMSTTTNKGSKKESLIDEAGNFTFANLPGHVDGSTLVIEPPKDTEYMVNFRNGVSWNINNDGTLLDGTRSDNIGSIEMHKGVTVNVQLVDERTGATITPAEGTVPAIFPIDAGEDEIFPADLASLWATPAEGGGYDVVVGVQGEDSIYVGQVDTNGDGASDYAPESHSFNSNEVIAGARKLTIDLTPRDTVSTANYKVTAGLNKVGTAYFADSAAKTITVHFDHVVVPSSTAVWYYEDGFGDVKDGATPAEISALNQYTELTAKAESVTSGLGIQYTFDTALKPLRKYNAVRAQYTVPSGKTLHQLVNLTFEAYDAATTVDTTKITADNFNASSDGTNGPATAFLVFSERVTGVYQVLSTTTGAVATKTTNYDVGGGTLACNVRWLSGLASTAANYVETGGVVVNQRGGTYNAMGCTQNLGIGTMADSTATTASEVSVWIDGYDVKGNAVQAKLDLKVK